MYGVVMYMYIHVNMYMYVDMNERNEVHVEMTGRERNRLEDVHADTEGALHKYTCSYYLGDTAIGIDTYTVHVHYTML